jgi:2-oxoglutarate ferredoxin oxidoreductase subunit alpha
MGDTTHLPSRHIQMTERRFSKLKLLEDEAYESEGVDSPIALLPWGGSKGPAREAYLELVEAGEDLAWYYTMRLNPLPPPMLQELRRKRLVLVPELNYLGQFSQVLRSQGVNAESITQYTGLPFKVCDLVKMVYDRVASERKESIAV